MVICYSSYRKQVSFPTGWLQRLMKQRIDTAAQHLVAVATVSRVRSRDMHGLLLSAFFAVISMGATL